MFVSNIPLSFSANFYYWLLKGQKRTFRTYVKPTVAGTFAWRFEYHNQVDSTWDDGSISRADMPGGHFSILSAAVAACDERQNILSMHTATFDGRETLDVHPCDQIISDPVTLTVAEGGYVMFSWCLMSMEEKAILPGTPDSRALCYIAETEETTSPLSALRMVEEDSDETSVLPNVWLADRLIDRTCAFIGDSITQGCQTGLNMYEQWAARIIRGLPTNVASLNVGLGYARAEDAARGGTWLKKLKGIDVVNVCLGVNDIFQMTSQNDHADELTRNLESAVRRIKENTPHCRVVLFTVPPFSMPENEETVRERVNARIRETGLGADAVFDMEILAVPGTRGTARFGEHPDGVGGAVAAGDYLSHFLPRNRHILFPEK